MVDDDRVVVVSNGSGDELDVARMADGRAVDGDGELPIVVVCVIVDIAYIGIDGVVEKNLFFYLAYGFGGIGKIVKVVSWLTIWLLFLQREGGVVAVWVVLACDGSDTMICALTL